MSMGSHSSSWVSLMILGSYQGVSGGQYDGSCILFSILGLLFCFVLLSSAPN